MFGGERMMGLWTLSGQAGYSRSSEDSPGHIAGATFEGIRDFTGTGFDDSKKPRLNVEDAFYDPANFALDKIDWEKQNTRDTEKNIRLDLARDYDLSGYAAEPSSAASSAAATRPTTWKPGPTRTWTPSSATNSSTSASSRRAPCTTPSTASAPASAPAPSRA